MTRGKWELLCIEILLLFFSPPYSVSRFGEETCHCRKKPGDFERGGQTGQSEHHTPAGEEGGKKVLPPCVHRLGLFLFTFYCRSPVQDELATTKRSYEDQLSTMSDHLCSLNETLSKQREEIDTLKLGSKVKDWRKKKLFIHTLVKSVHFFCCCLAYK